MAFPQVAGIKTDSDSTIRSSHNITFPDNLSKNDLLVGVIVVGRGLVTQILHTGFKVNVNEFIHVDSSSNPPDKSGGYFITFSGLSKGGTDDNIAISTISNCIASWIVYRITDHGNDATNPIHMANHLGYGSTFLIDTCPLPEEWEGSYPFWDTEDALWIDYALYDSYSSITPRSGFGDKLEVSKKPNSSHYSMAIVSARRELNAAYIDNDAWSSISEDSAYVTFTFKISPGDISSGTPVVEEDPPSFYVPNNRIVLP